MGRRETKLVRMHFAESDDVLLLDLVDKSGTKWKDVTRVFNQQNDFLRSESALRNRYGRLTGSKRDNNKPSARAANSVATFNQMKGEEAFEARMRDTSWIAKELGICPWSTPQKRSYDGEFEAGST